MSENDVRIAQQDLQKFSQGVQQLNQLGLPVGFACLSPLMQSGRGFQELVCDCYARAKSQDSGGWVLKVIGWLITGLAVALGAPFWFDLLNKLVNLRGAGPRPAPATPSK